MTANSRHDAVIQAYLADSERIGWRAYSAVYTKCSQRAAETAWSRLLRNDVFRPRLAAQIEKLQNAVTAQVVEKTGVTVERILTELALIGFAEVRKDVDWRDKRQALVDMGKHLGMFTELLSVSHKHETMSEEELEESVRLKAEALGVNVVPFRRKSAG